MTKLSFARAKLAEQLGDGAGLYAALQQLVKLFGARGELNYFRTLHVELGGGGEAHRDQLVRLHL